MNEYINRLVLGDNLEILKLLESETVDLIYLDPPFFSNRNYEVIWGDEGEVRSFQDRWSGGVDHYISWLKERVIEMHRILKSSGSLFLHCDWHANSYIKVEILDKIFGSNNFKNEIIWQRTNSKGLAFTRLSQNHDTIFYYSKTNICTWNPIYLPHNEDYLEAFYKYIEPETGRKYRLGDLTNPNKDRPNLNYEFLGINRVWRWTKERMQDAYEKGIVVQTKPGTVPQLKRYLDEQEGNPLDDNWVDISTNKLNKNERIGYPTQKPEVLLSRIIEMTSNKGDIVLDPFVGGGTTVAVADKLSRKWIGIDQSVQAIKVTEMRLQNQMDLFSNSFVVQLHKYDYDTLRYKDAFEFESWIIVQYGGTSNSKQRSDLGLDGKTKDNTPIQVKRSDNIGRNVIDNFHSAIMRYDKNLYEKNKAEMKPVGFIIAFSFGKGAIQEVARLHNEENIIIQLVTVEEIVPIAKKPTLTVELFDNLIDSKGQHEIEFKATGHSAAGVEFYSWDFDYKDNSFKAQILLDKKGEHKWKFKAGVHNIAVKVVDNDGLENIEVIKLKVNGKIERQ
jgi:DNA modification methylase